MKKGALEEASYRDRNRYTNTLVTGGSCLDLRKNIAIWNILIP